jgi:small conductance mechanosensitive channel
MDLQTTTPTCAAEDWWCNEILDRTGNAWLAQAANWLVAKPLMILLLLLVALLTRWVLHRVIDRLVDRAVGGVLPRGTTRGKLGRAREKVLTGGSATERHAQRMRAMGSLLKSIVTGVVFGVAAMMALSELGLNVAPLIASAGILGVALGFGAQSLVKDFLSGIFMMVEDQYGVGDVVDLGEANGTVEAVGLRVTRLRDVNGTVWHVRNGEVIRVGNMSQNWARTVLDVPVSFAEDLSRVRTILSEVAHDVWEDEAYSPLIVEEPEIWGVERWDPNGVVMRVTLKTAPMEQWAVAREMRERIKSRFDAEGIEIALPQRVVWRGEAPVPPRGPGSAAGEGVPEGPAGDGPGN